MLTKLRNTVEQLQNKPEERTTKKEKKMLHSNWPS